MEVFKTILTVLEAIASVALIVVVLLQSGKEAGLSGAIAGNSETYLSKSKGAGMAREILVLNRKSTGASKVSESS